MRGHRKKMGNLIELPRMISIYNQNYCTFLITSLRLIREYRVIVIEKIKIIPVIHNPNMMNAEGKNIQSFAFG